MNIKKIRAESLPRLKVKINNNFFKKKELMGLYHYYYSLMIENEGGCRLEYYSICIFILQYLLRIEKKVFNHSVRLDLLNCLYYGYLNLNLLSNKFVINSYFNKAYNLNFDLFKKKIITIEELKVITSLKFEFEILKNIMSLENEGIETIKYRELIEFNLKDKVVRT